MAYLGLGVADTFRLALGLRLGAVSFLRGRLVAAARCCVLGLCRFGLKNSLFGYCFVRAKVGRWAWCWDGNAVKLWLLGLLCPAVYRFEKVLVLPLATSVSTLMHLQRHSYRMLVIGLFLNIYYVFLLMGKGHSLWRASFVWLDPVAAQGSMHRSTNQ